jgi:hypothetical protein
MKSKTGILLSSEIPSHNHKRDFNALAHETRYHTFKNLLDEHILLGWVTHSDGALKNGHMLRILVEDALLLMPRELYTMRSASLQASAKLDK